MFKVGSGAEFSFINSKQLILALTPDVMAESGPGDRAVGIGSWVHHRINYNTSQQLDWTRRTYTI